MFGLTMTRNPETRNNQKAGKFIKTPKVLIVDDHEYNIMIVSTYLENFGYDYDVAYSGHEALDLVYRNSYRAILMDIQMPLMDGLETTRHIREIERKCEREHEPIIALTAHPLSGDRESCDKVGMDAYISKPFNPETLRYILESFITKEVA